MTVDITSPSEGDNVTLTCGVITTDDVTTYTWYHNNDVLIGSNEHVVTLINISRTLAGAYKCKVLTNKGLAKTSDEVDITVLCKYQDHLPSLLLLSLSLPLLRP